MEMQKPAPEAAASTSQKPQSAGVGTIEDLEHRLAQLGGAPSAAPAAAVDLLRDTDKKPAAAEKPKPAAAAPAVQGGKNALLVSQWIDFLIFLSRI